MEARRRRARLVAVEYVESVMAELLTGADEANFAQVRFCPKTVRRCRYHTQNPPRILGLTHLSPLSIRPPVLPNMNEQTGAALAPRFLRTEPWHGVAISPVRDPCRA